MFHNIYTTKGKILEAKTVHQGVDKMRSPHHKLYNSKRKASTVQTSFDTEEEIKHFNSECS